MALPFRTTGSLGPAFAPARLVRLAVKLACALARPARCPTALSEPSSSSVTLWEETAPVKLPTMHGPRSRFKGSRLEPQCRQAGISRVPPRELAPSLHRLPAILHKLHHSPMQSYSKG